MSKSLFFYGTGKLDENRLIDVNAFSEMALRFRGGDALMFISWKREPTLDIGIAAVLAVISAKVLWDEPLYWLVTALTLLASGLYSCLHNRPQGALSFTRSSIRGWYWEKLDCHIFEYPYHRITLVEVKKGKVRIELGRGIDYIVAKEFGAENSTTFLRTLRAHRMNGEIPSAFSVLS